MSQRQWLLLLLLLRLEALPIWALSLRKSTRSSKGWVCDFIRSWFESNPRRSHSDSVIKCLNLGKKNGVYVIVDQILFAGADFSDAEAKLVASAVCWYSFGGRWSSQRWDVIVNFHFFPIQSLTFWFMLTLIEIGLRIRFCYSISIEFKYCNYWAPIVIVHYQFFDWWNWRSNCFYGGIDRCNSKPRRRRCDLSCAWFRRWWSLFLRRSCWLLRSRTREWKVHPGFVCPTMESVLCFPYIRTALPQMGMLSLCAMFLFDIWTYNAHAIPIFFFPKLELCVMNNWYLSL